MMKSLFRFIIMLLPVLAHADVVNISGIDWEVQVLNENDKTVQIGNGKDSAISTETSGALIIPSSIPLNGIAYKVVSLADSAFYACVNLTSIEIEVPSCLISSGKDAFLGCDGLQKVIAPDLVAWCSISFANRMGNPVYYAKHIYSDANTEITDLIIPDGVKNIGANAFYGCTALSSIELPASMTSIGDNAFYLCSNLKEIKSNVLQPFAYGKESFASISSDAILSVPVGKMTAYYNAGWTNAIFNGGIVEVGEVVENFCLENGVTNDFIQKVVYPNDDYSFTKITDYISQNTPYIKDLPLPVIIEVPVTKDGKSLVLETYCDGEVVRSDTFCVGQKALEIWNLVPKTEYTYRLYNLATDGKTKSEVSQGSFKTEGQVRMMKIDSVRNFRDIGGWPLPNGRFIKYGKIFRCAELATTNQIITESGINELLKVQGIGVEIDFGDYSSDSPIGDLVEFVHGDDYQLTIYTHGVIYKKTQYKNCFEKVVSSLRNGKKVIFHCTVGADRTGGFAFFLEGLLGVSESDLAKDYELTSFYYDERYRTISVAYKGTVNYVKATYEGNTLNEKIEQMALDFGISQKDINDFRELMTDGKGSLDQIIPGDANGDGVVDVTDIVEIVNYLNLNPSERFDAVAADADGNTVVDIDDIRFIENIIMENE